MRGAGRPERAPAGGAAGGGPGQAPPAGGCCFTLKLFCAGSGLGAPWPCPAALRRVHDAKDPECTGVRGRQGTRSRRLRGAQRPLRLFCKPAWAPQACVVSGVLPRCPHVPV